MLRAMEQVPRERFVPAETRHMAYLDLPLGIGEGQTISQPFIVALMTQALELRGNERVLEVGTGSGYQAAVLSLMVPNGFLVTVERVPELAELA
ncbi:MAG TPA: protein-L-isoaspartate O-methyltransferase, partial [Dehalococcoidia bacterium]|nr:protein-L-isoaspartate O-methyltransferase [Dehalococcoidia bacterium]